MLAAPLCPWEEDLTGKQSQIFDMDSCNGLIYPVARSVRDFMNKYTLELTAASFLIVDADQASLDIACDWQRCMGGQVRITRFIILL